MTPPLTDLLASKLADGPMALHDLRSRAGEIDDRASKLQLRALEQLLESDPRFQHSGGLWQLTRDAPVPGAKPRPSEDEESALPPTEIDGLKEFCVIDVETTGLDTTTSSLIEIAALRVRDWEVIDEFSTLVYSQSVPPAVTALTGIALRDVAAAPEASEAVEMLSAFVGDLPILGQNVSFDLGVLGRVSEIFLGRTNLELLDLAHILYPRLPGRTLPELAKLLGVQAETAHRARADCVTSLGVAKALIEGLNRDEPRLRAIRRILHTSRHPWSRLIADSDDFPDVVEMRPPWLKATGSAAVQAPPTRDAFRAGGVIETSVPHAEPRPAQTEMANEVQEAFDKKGRMLIEAPTGTGKTYAYLVPALNAAATTNQAIWISTHTRALQTQLQSDFSRLKELGVLDGALAVLKGQENYLCTRDLFATAASELTPEAAVEVATLISLWAESDEGELGEATDYWMTAHYPDALEIKKTVRFNPATCERTTCEFYEACPYFAARAQARNAHIVAVNHALLVTELGSADNPRSEDSIKVGGLVIDEAHTLNDAATSILTEELSPLGLIAWLNRLIDTDSSSGLLRNTARAFNLAARSDMTYAAVLESVRRSRKAMHLFAERMATYLKEFVGQPVPSDYAITHRFRVGIDDSRFLFLEARQALFTVAELLQELREGIRSLLAETHERPVSEGFGAGAIRTRLRAESAQADQYIELALTLLKLDEPEHVRFVTWEYDEADLPKLLVTKAPIDVTPMLRSIYRQAPTTVATSATLSIGGTFDFMRERLAADDFTAMSLPHTFDYSEQSALVLTRHLPAPRVDREDDFVSAVADTAIASIGTARGGTLALFTSKRRTAAAYELAEPGVRYEGLDLRAQLPGSSTRELASWFRTSPAGSLFGLRSFWEGFDAPGETLRLLLIERIPFPTPADPMIAARSERMEAEGRDPFYELSVPMAALVFKQGFGRLIRSRDDRGAVVVLDRRLRTGMAYQSEFLDSLPEGLPLLFPQDEDEYLTTLADLLGTEVRLDLARGVGPRRSVVDLDRTTVTDRSDPAQITEAIEAIRQLFDISAFRPGQEELIRSIIADGRDVVGLLPTGAGKSMVYQAAAMCLDGVGLVVSPLVALMRDQIDGLRNDLGFRWAEALYGGQSGAERDEILDAVRQGGCRLLYLSPERLRDPSVIRALSQRPITFIAVDEAHCVSVWGHDFRPDFLTIMPALRQIADVDSAPRIALTATAPQEVLDDIVEQLELRAPAIEQHSVDRPNLHFSVIKCRNEKEKRAQLLRAVLAHGEMPGIVYCPTRKKAESSAALLRSHGLAARHYHAGMPPEQREAVELMFMADQVQVICATNAFGLGIDKPNIGFVVHEALPFSLDAYFQEAGRAARDSQIHGNAILLWKPHDKALLERLLSSSLPTLPEVEKLADYIAALPRPYSLIDDLAESLGLDEVSVRVGIHLLARAGGIDPRTDVAARAFVAVPTSLDLVRSRFGPETADIVQELAQHFGFRPPWRGVIDMLGSDFSDLAELENILLELHEQEVMGYRPVARAMNLEWRSNDWDRQAVSGLIRRLRRSAFDRLESIISYAKDPGCRRRTILAHFGEALNEDCGNCDHCSGEPQQLEDVDPLRYLEAQAVTEAVAASIIGLVREASRFGSQPGKGSFAKALKGVSRYASYAVPQVLQRSRHFGSLAYMTENEITEAIDELVLQGKLIQVEHQLSSGGTYLSLDVGA